MHNMNAGTRKGTLTILSVVTVAALVIAVLTTTLTVSAQSDDPDWRLAPTGLTIRAGDEAGELDITWDASTQSTKPFRDYRVTWAPENEDFKGSGQTDWNAYPTTNGWTVTGLDAGAAYKVRVRVRYGSQQDKSQSRWSEVVTANAGDLPSNTPATGQPVITGTAQVRETLTAATSNIADDNGLTNVVFNYQWVRNADGADTDISGATASTHLLGDDDLGHSIKVQVSFTDDDGYSETLTSDAMVVVRPPNVTASGSPTITGTAQVEVTLTADTSGISDGNGLTNVQFAYQWVRAREGTDTDISGSTGPTHTLAVDDLAHTVKVRVSFTDDHGYSESVTSNATGQVTRPPNSAASGQSTISGTPQVGETLTASTSGISDGNGLTNAQFAYQWIRNSDGTDTNVTSATGSTYLLAADDAEQTIKVRVSFTDDDGYPESVTSNATGPVARPESTGSADCNVPPASVGSNLNSDNTAVVLTWPAATECTPLGYSVFRRVVNEEERSRRIATTDTTVLTYTDTSVEGGKSYRYRIRSNNIGPRSNVTEVNVPQDAASRDAQPRAAGDASGKPAVSGVAQVDMELTAGLGTIADSDGLPGTFPDDYSFQWVSVDGGTDTNISGATGETYTLTDDEAGKTVKVQVSFTDAASNAESVTSDAYPSAGTILAARPECPSDSDWCTTLTVGVVDYSSLTAYGFHSDPGFGVDPYGQLGNDTITYGASGFEIYALRFVDRDSGDDVLQLEFASSDDLVPLGSVINIDGTDYEAVASSRSGSAAHYWTPSSGFAWIEGQKVTVAVTLGNVPARGTPTISGPAHLGYTLTAATDAIEEDDGLDNVSYTYQWIRVDGSDEQDISGATSSTYTLAADDVGKKIKVKVTFQDDGGNDEGPLTSEGYPLFKLVQPKPSVSFAAGSYEVREGQLVTIRLEATPSPEPGATAVFLPLTYLGVGGLTLADIILVPPIITVYAGFSAIEFHISAVIDMVPDEGEALIIRMGTEPDYTLPSELEAGTYTETRVNIINTSATGEPTLTGIPVVGQALTAGAGNIDDIDGLADATFTYQWERSDADGQNTVSIADEVNSAYTMTDDDAGKKIRVAVSFTDDAGNSERAISDAYPEHGVVEPDTLLVSNTHEELSESPFPVGDASSGSITQEFTTGNHTNGYIIESVGLGIDTVSLTGSETVTVSIHEFDHTETNNLGALVTTLTPPASLTAGAVNDFTAPEGTALAANQEYLLDFVGTADQADDLSLQATTADGETTLDGWSIRDSVLGSGVSGATASLVLIVKGMADPNDSPTFSSSYATTIAVNENAAVSANIGSAYTATDDDSDTLTYSLTDKVMDSGDAGNFAIDSSGQIKTRTGGIYNHEGKSSYGVTVNVTDGKNAAGDADTAIDDTIDVTINITNVDEAGAVSISGTVSGGEELTASVTDPDGSISNTSWRWSRGDTASGTFTNITTNGTDNPYTLVAADVGRYLRATAVYTDGQGSGKSAHATTGSAVGAGNAEPMFSVSTATPALPENSPAGANVGSAIVASDTDTGDTLTYSLSGADAGSFTVDSSGQIKAKSGIAYDFESSKKSYSVALNVRDSKDAAGVADTANDDSVAVTINLTNVNEAPSVASGPTSKGVPENSTAVATYTASDPDASTAYTWSVESADDGGKFDINSSGANSPSGARRTSRRRTRPEPPTTSTW